MSQSLPTGEKIFSLISILTMYFLPYYMLIICICIRNSMDLFYSLGNFEWLSDEKIEAFDIYNIPKDSERGFILEVDLDYPKEIHGHNADYPLAPVKVKVTYDMLLPYQKKILQTKLKEPEKYETLPKLIPNLRNKRNYIVHYFNLQLYLSFGMKLLKVIRVLSFLINQHG